MGYNRLKDIIVDCYDGGQNTFTSFRKTPAIASTAGSVIDFSMAPGNPTPNYYTGDALTSTPFVSSKGLWHGGNVYPKKKVLRSINCLPYAVPPVILYLCDYLMFYPLIDMDSTDEQVLSNTISLPRYSDGANVKAFLVATNPYIGSVQFFIKYTNHKGESGRISRVMTTNNNGTIATLVHSGVAAGVAGTFINLMAEDGIRLIESITFLAPNGGLGALVLCKVITNTYIRETTAPAEWDLLTMKGELPIIYDNAYLNFIGQVNGSALGRPLLGTMETIWD